MAALLGGMGLGLVWGWLIGGRRITPAHRLRTLLVGIGATVAVGATIAAAAGIPALISFAVASGAGAIAHRALLRELATRSTSR